MVEHGNKTNWSRPASMNWPKLLSDVLKASVGLEPDAE